MKKLLLSLLAIFALTFGAKATHITGGDIQYRYIGDSTGTAHQYEITLRVYRDCSPGTATGVGSTVYVKSSCYPQQNVTLTKINGPLANGEWPPPTYEDCVDPGTVKCQAINLLKGVVTLPGLCSDYTFYYQNCCRPGGVANLVNSIGQSFYFEAKLNNFLGNNSSAKFVSEPARAFCVGQNFNWSQAVVELDGDSLRYELISCRGNNSTLLAYTNGYTPTQPMITNPLSSFVLNQQTGIMNFTPNAVESVVIALEVQEYRFDSVYFQWVQIGSSNRELVASTAATCSQQAQAGVQLDYNHPTIYPDPVNGLPTVDYTCLDSSVTLHFSVKLDCSTISPDGTDFRLTAPTGQPIPVKAIEATCDVNNETDELLLKLHKPLAFNGKYFLYSKIGNDGNTLLNKCGFPMNEFDTIQLNVQGCFTTNMDMKNVTIEKDEYPRVEWELDTVGTPTAPFPAYLVDQYKVYRSDDQGQNYKLIWTLNDYKQMWFNDQSLGAIDVDNQSYRYKIEVIVNSMSAATTRAVKSIWLRTADGNPIWAPADSIGLVWTDYNGWPGPEYTVHLGKKDGAGVWVDKPHVAYNPYVNPTNDTTYVMINNTEPDNSLSPGDYRICIKADYPGGAGPYEAWSNCIPFTIYEPPIPPVDTPITVKIPNIITPNGDGVNDFFEIKGENGEPQALASWKTSRVVRIFNRWGRLVFESDNYSNDDAWFGTDPSGKKLADGVYFYTIELYDAPSDSRDEFKGEVTISGSSN